MASIQGVVVGVGRAGVRGVKGRKRWLSAGLGPVRGATWYPYRWGWWGQQEPRLWEHGVRMNARSSCKASRRHGNAGPCT